MKKFLIFIFIFLILIIPVVSSAQARIVPNYDGLVPCGQPLGRGGVAIDNWQCDFDDFIKLVNNVINFILVYMAVPIAAIMFVYAGFLMITAGEEAAGARTKAKGIFTNALIGLVLAATAWLIVKAILYILGYNELGTFFKL